jgi:hypothetical protein
MCEECFALVLEGAPLCERCAAELRRGPASRWPFAIVFAGVGLVLCAVGARAGGRELALEMIFSGLVVLFVAAAIAWSGKQRDATPPDIRQREPDLELGPDLLQRARSPYRARIARVAVRAAPLSGRTTALVLFAAFAVSAVALPLGLHLPRWLELELVLLAWWLAVATLLVTLLYKGWRLAHDHRFTFPGYGEDSSGAEPKPEKRSGFDPTALAEAGGCAEGVVALLVIALAAAAAWLVVEVVFPIAFFAVYYFVVKAIGRVAQDRHDCAGNLPRSLAWGLTWATLYVLPPALVIWAVQAIRALGH